MNFLVSNNSYTIGIDVGGSRVKAALVSPEGQLVGQIVEKSRVNEPYPAARDHLIEIIYNLKTSNSQSISAVGIGIAGLMNSDRRRVIAAPNCPGIIDVPLANDIGHAVGMPVELENDANVMALGEGLAGAAKGVEHFVAVTLGTGVGGAIVTNGGLFRGWQGGGSEIGHICIDRNGPRCGCGANGCVEAFIGIKGITHWLRRHAPHLRNQNIPRISELAKEGDADAIRLFEWIGKTLGVALGGMVNLFNPEAIVVGGGIASAGPMLFDPLREEIASRAFKVYLPGLKIVPAMLGNWAGVVGAGSLGREN